MNSITSVVMPTVMKDTGKMITAIQSVLREEPKELIVIVDTAELVDKISRVFPESVKVILQEGKGCSSARWYGVQHATGEIVAFTDDDVVVQKDYIKNIERHFEDLTIGGVGGYYITNKFGITTNGCIDKNFKVLDGLSMAFRKKDLSADLFVNIYPAEDTLLCLLFTKKTGKKLKKFADVKVFHDDGDLKQHIKRRLAYGIGKANLLEYSLRNKLPLYVSLFSPFVFSFGILMLLIGLVTGNLWIIIPLVLLDIILMNRIFKNYIMYNALQGWLFINMCHFLMNIGFIYALITNKRKGVYK